MRENFRSCDFKPESLIRIEQCNRIVTSFAAQGLRMSLRQLYYQLVTVNAISNTPRSYKNLGNLVSDARLAGRIDWDAIEDRVRVPRRSAQFDDLGDLVDAALASYRLPRWDGQPAYVELWVEKDALAGVLSPLSSRYHATLMVNKGYSSQSAMYEAAKRFLRNSKRRDPILFYLGDMDPSGEDMVRDVRDRLAMFGADVDVRKLALTMAQVRRYRLPPNPAKVTDSRARAYIAEHGSSSWEVDALPPNVLAEIITKAFDEVVDRPKMDAVIAQEELDKARLSKALANLQRKR